MKIKINRELEEKMKIEVIRLLQPIKKNYLISQKA